MKSWFLLYQNEHFQEIHFDATSNTLVSNGTFLGSFHFAANNKFKLLLFRQVSFPVNHGGLQADYYGGSGGRIPPVKQKIKLDFSCPNSARVLTW